MPVTVASPTTVAESESDTVVRFDSRSGGTTVGGTTIVVFSGIGGLGGTDFPTDPAELVLATLGLLDPVGVFSDSDPVLACLDTAGRGGIIVCGAAANGSDESPGPGLGGCWPSATGDRGIKGALILTGVEGMGGARRGIGYGVS